MALNTVSSDRLATNVKNTNFTAAEKQDLTDDILPLAGQIGSRNLVHNGEFIVSQRNFSSSAVTQTGEAFTIDRWKTRMSANSKFSVQQVADAPAGFYNSAKITSLAATTVGASDYYQFQHCIEGFNLNPADFGTATAKALTLSFHVKSSLTGTFSVCFSNNAGDRFLAQNYTISSADTWEKKTISVPAITTGSWNRGNTAGLFIYFTLGAGSGTLQSTGSWGTSFGRGGTGGANVVATNGATWQITGVQLEVGSVTTDFEHRSFGQELSLCHRYYYLAHEMNGLGGEKPINLGVAENSSTITSILRFPVTMRSVPTMEASSGSGFFMFREDNGSHSFNTLTLRYATKMAAEFTQSGSVSLTSAVGGMLRGANDDATLAFTAEL